MKPRSTKEDERLVLLVANSQDAASSDHRQLRGRKLPVRRADHPDDPRAFQLELTARGADRVVDAAAVMRELYAQLLTPIGGRTGKRHAALMQTLETLLDEAEAFNRANGPQAPEASRRPAQRSRNKRA